MVTISPGHPRATIRLVSASDDPGHKVDSFVTVTSGSQKVTVPVRGEITPLTFWDKYGRLVMTIAGGILFILVLLFFVYGFIKPHSFPSDARVSYGNSVDRMKKNDLVIRELPGTGKGFYRNAKLVIGGPTSFLSGGAELATIEATGPSQMEIRAASGVTLEKVNKFDHAKTTVVDGDSAGLHLGQIYRIGELYLRIT